MDDRIKTDQNGIEHQAVERWIHDVIVGLNLCPFARKPLQQGLIKIVVTNQQSPEQILTNLQCEMRCLKSTPPSELETTLLVTPNVFEDFYDYNDFLDQADWLIDSQGWRGEFQIASFHPQYRFAETEEDDLVNLTNRAPYPLFHILRENSLSAAIERYPDWEKLTEENQNTVRNLTDQQRQHLFSYLFDSPI